MWGEMMKLKHGAQIGLQKGDSPDESGSEYSHKIRRMISQNLSLWKVGQYADLTDSTVTEGKSWIAWASSIYDKTEARAFNSKSLNARSIRNDGLAGSLHLRDD